MRKALVLALAGVSLFHASCSAEPPPDPEATARAVVETYVAGLPTATPVPMPTPAPTVDAEATARAVLTITLALTPTPTALVVPTPVPTPDVRATAVSVASQALATVPTPVPTPDVEATARAALATVVAMTPTATPVMLPTPQPTPDVRPTAEAAAATAVARLPEPTPIPTPNIQATAVAAVATAIAENPPPTPVPGSLSHPVIFIREDFTIEDIRDTIVRIGGAQFRGSGVLISDGEVLTAYHVVRGLSGVTVTIEGVGQRFATVRGYDQDRDVALLTYTPGAGTPTAARLAGDTAFIGNSIVVIGFTGQSETLRILTYGRITERIHWVDTDTKVIQIDAPVNPGNSGGGVFDEQGLLVGMLTARSAVLEGVAYAVMSPQLEELLPDLRAGVKR